MKKKIWSLYKNVTLYLHLEMKYFILFSCFVNSFRFGLANHFHLMKKFLALALSLNHSSRLLLLSPPDLVHLLLLPPGDLLGHSLGILHLCNDVSQRTRGGTNPGSGQVQLVTPGVDVLLDILEKDVNNLRFL